MTQDKVYRIDNETTLQFRSVNLTPEDIDRLERWGIIEDTQLRSGSGIKGQRIDGVQMDFQAVRELAYEYDLLQKVASRVETQILDCFRSSKETTLTTAEIADQIDRPKSSISRSLGQLVEKGQLTKVQNGVYRRAK
ncbi:helix-turn-helix domain-containing protein [Natrinema sp. H-ect1]|uniref:helix-turn-helix domain-containing protein n=1 Tax=Natrinema sp. H-ect1 TaxID=3242700 RepID=UPI0009FFC345